jgi:glyoxylase-like metal-dependent hydrolase (beta-lactamase superfamily II)
MPENVAPGVELVDVEYLGDRETIAAGVLETPAGLGVVDPGPTTSLDGLRAGLAALGATEADLRWVLLTHIHLDHAGGTGVLVRDNPELRVYVHERGARHLADPTRLLESATRIYGDRMAALWGEFLPVPGNRIRPLRGGERLDLGGRAVEVAAVPGHAVHHVAYLDGESGTAFVGDLAGERYPGVAFAIPVTPPPDVDLESWKASWDVVRGWDPAAIFLTHFGVFPDARAHLDQLEQRTERWAERVRSSLAGDLPDADRAHAFYAWVEEELRRELPVAVALRYTRVAGVLDSWYGLARYWRKKAERGEA